MISFGPSLCNFFHLIMHHCNVHQVPEDFSEWGGGGQALVPLLCASLSSNGGTGEINNEITDCRIQVSSGDVWIGVGVLVAAKEGAWLVR